MLLLPVHGATAGCLDGCVRDGAAPIRVRFVTHGRQSDSFWQAMRDNVINSAAVFGAAFDPAADWVWYESDAAQAATIRSHSDTSVALIVSAQSNQVAAAVRGAAAAGVRVLGINSGLTLLRAAGADLSAYVGTDERLRGAKAAEHMIAAGVSNPVSWKRCTTIGRAAPRPAGVTGRPSLVAGGCGSRARPNCERRRPVVRRPVERLPQHL